MSAISEMTEVQARELAGLQGTVFRWLGTLLPGSGETRPRSGCAWRPRRG